MSDSSNSESQHRAARCVTAIICTFNRCATLGATLEGLAASQMPADVTWEVLVVDNNSTDQTREVAEDFCRRYPHIFRYIFEPRSGKSYAANTGVKTARGEAFAFIDDDVTVDPGWLYHITASLFSGEWAGAGGRTLAARSFVAPAWYHDEDDGALLYGRFDFGDEPRELECAPYGANMAFRRDMFEQYGGFRIDLGPGPDPEIPRPNEDTEYGRRLMLAGRHLRYEPKAVLWHPVNVNRLDQKFYLAWSFDYGRASALEIKKRPVFGIKREYFSMLKHMILLPMETLAWIFSFSPQTRFRHKRAVWRIAGRISQTYRRLLTRADQKSNSVQEAKSDLAAERHRAEV
jgi:glycosyltransferase involved in cell wall biosynthesis